MTQRIFRAHLVLFAVCSGELNVSSFVIGCYTETARCNAQVTKGIIRDQKAWRTRLLGIMDASNADDEPRDGPNLTLPPKLVRSLDLAPLLEAVSRYAATRRGRDALLKVIGYPSSRSIGRHSMLFPDAVGEGTRRKTIASRMDFGRTKGYGSIDIDELDMTRNQTASDLVKIVESASEANAEYELVRQASVALRTAKLDQKQESASRSKTNDPGGNSILSCPPIYAVDSSPFDISEVDTDDDEWLTGIVDGSVGVLELENILQADQIVKRLIRTKAWAEEPSTQRLAPGLSHIASQIHLEALEALHEDISNSVQVIRERSFFDPTGTKTYSFRLNGDKFPSLGILRKKEVELMADMDSTMQNLLRNKSFSSLLNGGKGNAEAFELRGRLVVTASRDVAGSLGVIRGFSKKKGGCYVEPKDMIEKGDELLEIRAEIESIETQVTQHLVSSIFRAAPSIESGMKSIARIDTIFARAAYGQTMTGVIPHVGSRGEIMVDGFVHPVLAANSAQKESKKVVPVDLKLDSEQRSLVISGPNGGGKTVALKSFGLAAVMCKLALPIPVNSLRGGDRNTRVDFFCDIFVDVGDQQSVHNGESTLMAKLNGCASVIQKLNMLSVPDIVGKSPACAHTLVLLDELGGGTDPEAGSALAQAILEKILECDSARCVSTTHSPQLKALSFNDRRFSCASVLLDMDSESSRAYKLPTYKLAYGVVGDSYAFGAASRSTPSLPDDVLQRAADILSGGEGGSGEVLRAIASSLEREREAAEISSRAAEALRRDALECRRAMVSLARAYEDHLSRLENRLETICKDLRDDESRDNYELVGESLAELRHVKKRVKTDQELLAERGLKMVPAGYDFKDGESVVIIAKGEWDGQTAVVSLKKSDSIASECAASKDQIVVIPSFDWGGSFFGNELPSDGKSALLLTRSDIALWDYPNSDWEYEMDSTPVRSVSESKQRLFNVLSSLSSEARQSKGTQTPTFKSSGTSFKSSRERKAAALEAKKDRKGSKRKKKN